MFTVNAPLVRDINTWMSSVLKGTTMIGSPSSQTVTLTAWIVDERKYSVVLTHPQGYATLRKGTYHPVISQVG
jgi:hypothetical protein